MEKLKKLLGEELFAQVEEKLGTEKNYFFGEGEFIPKQRLDEKIAEVNDYKSQMEARDKQLVELQEKAKGSEETTKAIEELKAQNEKARVDYEANLASKSREYAVDTALIGSGARNLKAAKALLDLEKIENKDNTWVGLSEQIDKLKESDPYIFEQKEKNNKVGLKPGNGGEDDEFAEFRKIR